MPPRSASVPTVSTAVLCKSERSTFYLCERSLTDPEYRKYPPLPVLRCPGYEPLARATARRPAG